MIFVHVVIYLWENSSITRNFSKFTNLIIFQPTMAWTQSRIQEVLFPVTPVPCGILGNVVVDVGAASGQQVFLMEPLQVNEWPHVEMGGVWWGSHVTARGRINTESMFDFVLQGKLDVNPQGGGNVNVCDLCIASHSLHTGNYYPIDGKLHSQYHMNRKLISQWDVEPAAGSTLQLPQHQASGFLAHLFSNIFCYNQICSESSLVKSVSAAVLGVRTHWAALVQSGDSFV